MGKKMPAYKQYYESINTYNTAVQLLCRVIIIILMSCPISNMTVKPSKLGALRNTKIYGTMNKLSTLWNLNQIKGFLKREERVKSCVDCLCLYLFINVTFNSRFVISYFILYIFYSVNLS